MSVPLGQLLAPNTGNAARGGVLSSVTDFMNQRRMQEVQDDTLARDRLTRGLINTQLGIDEDANFKDFLGFQESQSGQALQGAQTGLAQANALLSGERARGLRADAEKAEITTKALQEGKAFQDYMGGQFMNGMTNNQFSSGNAFQDQLAGSVPEQFKSQFGNQARVGFDQIQTAAQKRSQDALGIQSQTPALADRAKALGQAGLEIDVAGAPLKKSLAEHQADLARQNTQAAQQGSFNHSNQLDINRGERTQEASDRIVAGLNSQVPNANIDPRLGPALGMDMVTMQQTQRQGNISKLQDSYDLLFKKGKDGSRGKPHKNTEASRKAIEEALINEINSLISAPGQTQPDLGQILNAQTGAHQGAIDQANGTPGFHEKVKENRAEIQGSTDRAIQQILSLFK